MHQIVEIGGTSGIVIVAVVLILREVRAIIDSKKNGRPDTKKATSTIDKALIEAMKDIVAQIKSLAELLNKIGIKIHDLHDWHNKEDDEGVKVWYVRKSLETAIEKLSDNIEKLTRVVEEFARERKG